MTTDSNFSASRRLIPLMGSIAAAISLITIGLNGSLAAREAEETVPYAPRVDESPSATPAPTSNLVKACDGTPLAKPTGDVAEKIQKTADEYGVHVEAAWVDPTSGVQRVGETAGLEAWSTAKVPIALAVVGQGRGEEFRHEIAESLRISDNDDAVTLWESLGPDEMTRAEAVDGVLRNAGDNNTLFSKTDSSQQEFGLTIWDVSDQVIFLENMPCLTGADQIINDLSNIDESQKWGIGIFPGAVFKGGWGPSQHGFVSRQFGWFTNSENARVIVAIAVLADDEDSAHDTLTAIAKALAE